MPGRSYQNTIISGTNDYRYGFNGKELDKSGEFGSLAHYDYGFRIYNPAIGKFLSVDPLAEKFPAWSPFNFVLNCPIRMVDPDGRSPFDIIIKAKFGDDRNYVKRTFDILQENTTSKLKLDIKTGKASIIEGKGNPNANNLKSEIVDNLINDQSKTTTITYDGDPIGYGEDKLISNAFTLPNDRESAMDSKKGSGSTIYFSPDVKGKKDLPDGTRAAATPDRVLMHELIHAENNRRGIKSSMVPRGGGKYPLEESNTILIENSMYEKKRKDGN